MVTDTEKKRQRDVEYYQRNKEKKQLYYAEYQKKNAERIRQKDATYREANREKIREWQHNYYQAEHEKRLESARKSHSREEYQAYMREYLRRYGPKRRLEEREKLLDALGRKCARCGYNADVRALQIDHVNGGGTQERRQFPNFQAYYAYILQNAANGNYQILCANCNVIKRMEEREHRRISPHKQDDSI